MGQRFTDLQQQIAELQKRLDATPLRKTVNEVTATNQVVQLLLCHKYRDLVLNHLPLPELWQTEFRCFSQNGEDGILLYLFTILGITNKQAIEMCSGDGTECNLANLIINHGWSSI